MQNAGLLACFQKTHQKNVQSNTVETYGKAQVNRTIAGTLRCNRAAAKPRRKSEHSITLLIFFHVFLHQQRTMGTPRCTWAASKPLHGSLKPELYREEREKPKSYSLEINQSLSSFLQPLIKISPGRISTSHVYGVTGYHDLQVCSKIWRSEVVLYLLVP